MRSLYILYVLISASDNIYAVFAKDKGKLAFAGKAGYGWETERRVSPELRTQTRSLSPSYNHLLGRDIAGMPLVICEGEEGGARCLPAARGCQPEQQQQLSGRDRKPTAPSRRAQRTSLVLGEVCG